MSDKMDITMVLNPQDPNVGSDHNSSNIKKDEDTSMTDIYSHRYPKQQQPQSIDALDSYQYHLTRMDGLGEQNRSVPIRTRISLPSAPGALANNRTPYHGNTHSNNLPSIHELNQRYYCPPSPPYRHPQATRRFNSRSSRPTKSKADKPHNNKAYTTEEVDWIRYHKDDLNLHWAVILVNFGKLFPERARDSEQCLSSRYYRSNRWKKYDGEGKVMRDENGKVLYLSAKVRTRSSADGKREGLPYTLVEKHPERALKYSWVRAHHRSQARRLALEMNEHEREVMFSIRAQKLRQETGSDEQEVDMNLDVKPLMSSFNLNREGTRSVSVSDYSDSVASSPTPFSDDSH